MNAISKNSNPNFMRIARNAISLFLEGVIGRLCNFFFMLVVIRHLTTFDFGFYSAILSFVMISGFLAEFGVSQVLVREIAQQKTRSTELFSGAIIVCLLLYVIIGPCTIIAAVLLGYARSFIYLVSFAVVGIIGNTLVSLAGAVLRGHERMASLSLLNSGILVCSAVVGIIWLQHGAGIRELIVLFVATPTINALSLVLYLHRDLTQFSLSKGLMMWKGLFGKAIPLAVFNLCGIVVLRFDILLLSKTAGMGDAGVYSAARNITDSLSLFTQSMIGAVFPFIAVKWKESLTTAVKNYEQILRLLVIFGMAATVGVFLLSDKIILLLYGERYLSSVTCLKILIWSFMLGTLAGPVGMFLVVTEDRLNYFIPFALSIMFISIILNIWLTPTYGYYSASCIAVFSSLTAFIFRLIAIGDMLPVRLRWLKMSWRPIVASIIMGISLQYSGNLPLAALVALGFVTYIMGLLVLGEFGEEYRMIMRYLKAPVQQ